MTSPPISGAAAEGAPYTGGPDGAGAGAWGHMDVEADAIGVAGESERVGAQAPPRERASALGSSSSSSDWPPRAGLEAEM